MSKNFGPLSGAILSAVGEATGYFTWPIEGSREWVWNELHSRKVVRNSLQSMRKRGLIKRVSKEGKIFFQLTAKGELQLLLSKATFDRPKVWDGQWRILIFDIPEDCRDQRDVLRRMLKSKGFIKLQASVFVHPYPLNREAVNYLQQSGLINYIRIIKANEIDDDSDLRKKFSLPSKNITRHA